MHNKKLFLISDKNNFPKNQEEKDIHWVFLGRDYERLMELKGTAPDKYHFIDVGDCLLEIANKLRRLYLDFIGSQSQRFFSLWWWSSCIAEKNVMSSPVFLYICYLHIIIQLMNKSDKNVINNLCIFSESPALLEIIKRHSVFNEYKIYKFYRKQRFSWIFKSLSRIASFCFLGIKRKFWIVLTKKKRLKFDGPITILRTWVSEKNISEDGTFKDSYFPGLADYLKRQGKVAVTLPFFCNVKRPYREIINWFRSNRELFIIPEDFYKGVDYLMAIATCFRSFILFKHEFVFNNLDVTALFHEENRRVAFGQGMLLDIIMHYFLIERIRNQGIEIEKFIITFENMVHEKPLLIGLSEHYPHTKRIGFQHSVLYPLQLGLYISEEENNIIPMPDEIICSGQFFKQIMIKEGYPENRIVVGPALRFQHLWQTKNSENSHNQIKEIVLITLPLAESSALELLSKSWFVLKQEQKIKIWLKAHPLMSMTQLKGIMRKASVPKEKFKIVDGSIKTVLPQVGFAIAAASGAVLDAVAFGLPIIRIRQDLDLNLDPMDWFPYDKTQFVARTPEEIKREIERILALDKNELKQLKESGRKLIERCFSPVTEETLAVFMN